MTGLFSFSRHLSVCLMTFWMVGCNTAQLVEPVFSNGPNCQNTDWYEAGRLDGAMGKTPTALQAERSECLKSASEEDLKKYEIGRNAGLVEYCSPTSGFELGRNGTTYNYVCPQHLEPSFLSQYDRGQRLTRLEKRSLLLNSQIKELQSTLNREPSGTPTMLQTLQQQLQTLSRQKERTEAEMAQVRDEAARSL